MMASNEVINIRPKSDDDTMMGQMTDEKMKLQLKASNAIKNGAAVVDWELPLKVFESVSRENLLVKITETVLQTKGQINKDLLARYINTQSRETYIKTTIVYLMSTPEYQLC
jgi:hypothetical protein